eukprot:10990537-Ditylum_brightwellii.AAC.1
MESMSGEETLQSKHAYERVAAMHGVHVKQYHLDNGRFGEKAFGAACDEQGQEIIFCGIGAHHQNRIAENQIKLLTLNLVPCYFMQSDTGLNTLLLCYGHVHLKWQKPTATKYDVDKDGILLEEKFSNVCFVQTLTEQHTWGCPVYILGAHLQDKSGSVPKWDPRARLEIYLSPSSVHT